MVAWYELCVHIAHDCTQTMYLSKQKYYKKAIHVKALYYMDIQKKPIHIVIYCPMYLFIYLQIR